MTSEWQPTACILCECNCGIVVQLEGRTLARIRGDKEHPASRGYTCNKALRLDHYQNNRNRLTSPMRRRADGSYEEIDWDTAIIRDRRRIQAHPRHATAATRSSTTAAAARATTSAAAYSGAFLKALGARYRSNALAQEKTGEALGRRAALRRAHPRRVRARRGVGVRRQEPVDVAELPAGPGGAQRDRQGSRTAR